MTPFVFAQNEPNPIYSIKELSDTYQLTRLNTLTQKEVVIYQFSKISDEIFSKLSPQTEVDAVQKQGDNFLAYLDRQMSVKPILLTVSPDQKQVAISIEYSTMPAQGVFIAGFTQVWVIDGETGSSILVLTLGFNSEQFLSESQRFLSNDLYIKKIIWMPNQMGLLAELSFPGISIQTFNLVAIPLQTSAAFLVDNINAYDMSPDSQYVFAISGFTSLKTFSIDLTKGAILISEHFLDGYVVSPDYGLAVTSSFIHFDVAYDANLAEGGGGLVFLQTVSEISGSGNKSKPKLSPVPKGFKPIGAKKYGDTVYIESADKAIWRVTLTKGTPTFTPFIAGPIDFWDINGKGDILFHQQNMSSLQILPASATLQSGSELLPQASSKALSVDTPVDQQRVLIDW